MIIGSCSLKLMIYESNSLKDKRHIIRSIVERIKSRFNVSIAEVGLNDSWRTAIIGFVCVSNDTGYTNQIISKVLKFIDGDSRVEILDYDIEII